MKRKKKTVVVSGGFDPLHIGHVRLFERARKMGDELVVILNNDNWLKKKKDDVFMSERERKEIIKALSSVDKVVLTSHKPNPVDMSVCAELIKIKPAIFVNGGDRIKKNIPEIAVCEKIGCKMIFGAGRGGKVQSSSWLLEKHTKSLSGKEKNFEVIARAVIIHNNKILLCKQKDKDYYFLPGGHVEWGEKTEDALARELMEELGVSVKSMKFIGAAENIFSKEKEQHHELNLVFYTKLEKITTESCEDHICFCLLDIAKLSEENLLPFILKKSLVKWLEDKKIFWVSQHNNRYGEINKTVGG